MLLTLASGDLSAQIRLTDVTIFSADNVGNWTGPDIWQTRPRGHYVIFIQDGPSGGPFLNGQTSEAVQPNIPLPLGDYSFRIAASAGADYPNFGINLFFDGATKPSISAFAPLRTSPTAPHSFEASKASYTSGPVPYNGVPGAGTLSFESGNQRITLVDFYWATPSAYDLDLVGGYSPGPDGMNDYVGVMMLSVTPLEPTPPRIVTQPSDQIASAGFDATFSVTAVGSLPFSYQWFFEGSALTDATNAQLSLTNLTLAQAGAYSVQITNLYGSVTSAVAKLSVVSVSTAFFDDFELYAYRSQWATFGGVILATNYGGSVSGTNSLWFGGYGSRFAVTRPLDTSNGGVVQFYLRLGDQDFYTNRFSSNWELVELTHKGIVLESSTDGGQTWVELGRYDTPDFYQWTKVTLPISKEAQSAGTQFRWRQLYNTGAPFDHWALDDVLIALGPTPPVVVTQPQSSTNGTETSVTFRAVVTGSRPMTYQWRHDESDLTNDTRIVGADSDTLTISGLQLSDAGNYALIATNPNGSTTSVVAVLTVLLSPSITTQPISQTILEGENVTFDVIAEGTPPLFYHWQKNGRILFGATGKSLSLTNAHLFDAGDYTVVVANSVASTTSAVAVLTVQAPPVITAQPLSQTVFAGSEVVLNVKATGTSPLFYQWRFEGSDIPGATTPSFVITNVQAANAGVYSVLISNAVSTATSANAVLAVNPLPSCAPVPAGIVAWWQANDSTADLVGTNGGQLINGASYASGRVGSGFLLNGITSKVDLGDPEALRFTNSFSIEGWIWVNAFPAYYQGHAQILFRGDTRYCADPYYFCLRPSGSLRFHIEDDLGTIPCGLDLETTPIEAKQWKHVAAVFDASSGSMQVFVDGQLAAQTNTVIRPFRDLVGTGGVAIGNLSEGYSDQSFNGIIDELSVYARALVPSEIQTIFASGPGGKCNAPIAPWISAQPSDQDVTAGANATFMVTANGTAPLSYQWRFNGSDLIGETNSSVTITNVGLSHAGHYSVNITNIAGAVTSAEATLTVQLPPALVQVLDGTTIPGGTVTLPVVLTANGNENALGFSLNFDPTLLTYVSATLGTNAQGATLLVNASQSQGGRLGIALALPTGTAFAAGNQELVMVSFSTAVTADAASTQITFGDLPTQRQLSDVAGVSLPVTFKTGSVALPGTEFEGDAVPRPGGDKALTITDWVTLGRYVARLDFPTNSAEFQRADCAPRETFGDGVVEVTDWVQAGRYAVGLDPLTPVGGPSQETTPESSVAKQPAGIHKTDAGLARKVKIAASPVIASETATVTAILEAKGNENALAFSLAFDPSALTYKSATLASAASGATLHVNATQASQGRLGVALALGVDNNFGTGSKQVLNVTFGVNSPVSASYPVSLASQPVPQGVSDANALALAADYVSGAVVVNPTVSLSITQSPTAITLAWPSWATTYVLQEAESLSGTSTKWSSVTAIPQTKGDETVVVLPTTSTGKFYRLQRF